MTREEQARVRETLEQLDHDDDEFWTEQGMPRVHPISTLSGFQLNREQLNEMAPNFMRHQRKLPWLKEDEPKPEEPIEESTEDLDLGENFVADDPDAIREQIKQADSQISELDRAVGEAQAALARARRERDALIVQTPEKTDPQKTQRDIRDALRAQLKGKQNDARRRQEFVREHGLQPRDIAGLGGSRLDRSMASKRGFGLNRPNRPVTG